MTRTRFALTRALKLALMTLACWIPSASLFAQEANPTPRSGRPNVLLVITDDQGYGDVGSHGNPAVNTPHQDRLAQSGARFDRFYVSPVCAPTRASLLTGRWHLRTGVHGVTRGNETMRAEEVTIAETMRGAGYATAAFGKWHNGAHHPHHPLGQGFDHFYGFCGGHFNNYFDSTLEDDGRVVPFEGFIIDRLTDRAIQFIEQQQQPWFCYIAFNTPHSPWQVPDKYWERMANRPGIHDEKARCAYAMVENIDDNLGRLLATLTRLKIDDETIVVFLTDNGANSDRYNAGMKGRKGSLHEGGTRVPCFMRWTGHIPESTVVAPITAHVDLLPTLCELAGISPPYQRTLDGKSCAPLVLNTPNIDWPQRTLFTHWGDAPSPNDPQQRVPRTDRGAVRTDQWRAVRNGASWELYDMQQDPGQTRDIADAHPEITDQLADAYRAWFEDVTKDGFEPIPTWIGHAEGRQVRLPAHEAVLYPAIGEGIRYRGRAGWANDWITNWTSTDSYASWPVRVLRDGVYDVSIRYAASQEQTETVLKLVAGPEVLEAAIEQPHDAPTVPSPDRIARGEVFERQWGERRLGSIRLARGVTSLELHLATLTANEACDVKEIIFTQRAPDQPDPRPNFVILMADDMGFSDIGCYGGEIQTPHLDRLARQGMRFTQFYNNAKCEPTRATLLTGQYPQHTGAGAQTKYRTPTFGEVLQQAGYRTLMAGKWHAAETPHQRGFDRHFGLTDGCCNFFNPGLPRPGEPVPSHKSYGRRWAIDDVEYAPYSPSDPRFYSTDAFSDAAIKFLETYASDPEPICLYVAFTAPHYPMHAWQEDIQRYRGKYSQGWNALRTSRYERLKQLGLFDAMPELSPPDPKRPDWASLSREEREEWDHRMAVYAAMVDRMDQNIGRLLDALDRVGRADNTLVLFFSDNGGEPANQDWSRERGTAPGRLDGYRTVGMPWANASNTPFRKYKTFNHEGGISTPLVVRWPGVVKPGSVSHQPGHLIDILPTLVELARADYPSTWNDQPTHSLPGMSLVPAFQDPSHRTPRELYWNWRQAGALRSGDWKIVREKSRGNAPAAWELYHLANDRSELNDLAKEHPDRVQAMAAQWEAWQPTGIPPTVRESTP